jgi:hypothetical protein
MVTKTLLLLLLLMDGRCCFSAALVPRPRSRRPDDMTTSFRATAIRLTLATTDQQRLMPLVLLLPWVDREIERAWVSKRADGESGVERDAPPPPPFDEPRQATTPD